MRTVEIIGIVAVLVVVNVARAQTSGQKPLEHTKESPEAVHRKIDAHKALLLDVRELSEWREGHLADAKSFPISRLVEMMKREEGRAKLKSEIAEAIKKVRAAEKSEGESADGKPDEEPIVIYCHCRAGRRALRATELLRELGFEAQAIKPGFEELVKAGFAKAPRSE